MDQGLAEFLEQLCNDQETARVKGYWSSHGYNQASNHGFAAVMWVNIVIKQSGSVIGNSVLCDLRSGITLHNIAKSLTVDKFLYFLTVHIIEMLISSDFYTEYGFDLIPWTTYNVCA